MKQTSHQDQVKRCAAEIRGSLPKLIRRHRPLILIAAMTQHVASSLFLSQQARICSPEEVRAIIERVKQLAFAP